MATDRPTRRQLIRGAAALGLSAALAGAAEALAPPGATPADGRTLADILPVASWEADSRGPLLIVDPAGTRRIKDENGVPANLPDPDSEGRVSLVRSLTAFARRTYPMGTLTVIAPAEMTLVSDDPPKNPSMWEGLSRTEKMQYLLSVLSPPQWEKLGSDGGLGAGDLTSDDQRSIFLSLLPEPFAVRSSTVDARGSITYPGDKRTLSAEERSQVRLRMHVTLSFMVPILSQPGSLAGMPDMFTGQPGDKATVRDDSGEYDTKTAFGVDIATRVQNRPKASDLAYETDPRLAVGLSLTDVPTMATIANLVNAVQAATGIELIPDFRIASLPVTVLGAAVRAGDLLKATALAVCGTWRRVGDSQTYVLTADRTGAGARKLRLADWYADLGALKEKHVTEWRNAAVTAGLTRYITPRASMPMSPGPDLDKRVASIEMSSNPLISTSDLTPGMREYLRQMFVMYGQQSDGWDRTQVRAMRNASAQFVLPDGTPLVGDPNMNLGPMMMFARVTDSVEAPDDGKAEAAQLQAILNRPGMPRPPLPVPAGTPVIALAAAAADEAGMLASMARRYGFRQLWIRTDDPAIAAAAIAGAKTDAQSAKGGAAPLPVWAVASVFGADADAADADLDRNLAGETGPQAAKSRAATARWPTFVRDARLMTFPRPDTVDFAGPPATVMPAGKPLAARTERLVALASVPSLAGLSLDPRLPAGYETTHPEMMEGGYDAPLCVRAEMGYTVEMRSGFLRSDGVDPVDLIPEYLNFPSDLRTPFFLDDRARGMSSVYNGRDNPTPGFAEKGAKWDAFRGARRLDALAALRKAIQDKRPDLAVLAAPIASARLNGQAPVYAPAGSYDAWIDPAVPPAERVNGTNPFAPSGSAISTAVVLATAVSAAENGGDTTTADFAVYAYSATSRSPRPGQAGLQQPPRVLDLSELSPAAASALLTRWIAPATRLESPISRAS